MMLRNRINPKLRKGMMTNVPALAKVATATPPTVPPKMRMMANVTINNKGAAIKTAV